MKNQRIAYLFACIALSFQQNMGYYKADPDSEKWHMYVEYIDEMVVEGFVKTIYCCLNFLLDNTDPKNNVSPLFEASLELQVNYTLTNNVGKGGYRIYHVLNPVTFLV